MQPIKLKDGREITQIDEDDLPTDLYFRFQRHAAKNVNNPQEAARWLILQLFLLDGKPMSLDHLTEKPPVGIGFRAVAKLGRVATSMVQGLPDPKASSDSADLLAGE